MKVKCINNDMAEKYLTVGKEYDVIGVTMQNYVVINNNGNEGGWDVSRFEEVTEPQSHHNTTNLRGAALEKAESKAKSQERIVYCLFVNVNNKWTVGQVWKEFFEPYGIQKVGIGRAFTNLLNQGKIGRTHELREGQFGASEHYYVLIR